MKKFSEILNENLNVNEIPKRIDDLKTTINKLPLKVNDLIKSQKGKLIDTNQVNKLTLISEYVKSINDKSKNSSEIESQINNKLAQYINSEFIDNITTDFANHYNNKNIVSGLAKYKNFENLIDTWFEKSNNKLDNKLLIDFISEELIANFNLNSYLHRSFTKFLNDNIFPVLDNLQIEVKRFDKTTQNGSFEKIYINQINTQIIPVIESKFAINNFIKDELSTAVNNLLNASQIIKNETIFITNTQINISKTEELAKKSEDLAKKSDEIASKATEIDIEFGKFKAKVKTGSIIVAICFMIMVGIIAWRDKENPSDLVNRIEKIEKENIELKDKTTKLENDVNQIIIQNDRLIKELKQTQETFNKFKSK